MSLEGNLGRVLFFRIMEDEDLLGAVTQRARQSGVKAGFFFLIGTLKNAVLGYYHDGKYESIKIDEPLEIASCVGNVSVKDSGELVIHGHMVVSNKRGEAFGGHLMSGCRVAATVELVMVEADVALRRAFDEKTKLHLWSLEK